MSEYPTNRQGLVVLKKGDAEFDCVPESVPVWLEAGWNVTDDEKDNVSSDVPADSA